MDEDNKKDPGTSKSPRSLIKTKKSNEAEERICMVSKLREQLKAMDLNNDSNTPQSSSCEATKTSRNLHIKKSKSLKTQINKSKKRHRKKMNEELKVIYGKNYLHIPHASALRASKTCKNVNKSYKSKSITYKEIKKRDCMLKKLIEEREAICAVYNLDDLDLKNASPLQLQLACVKVCERTKLHIEYFKKLVAYNASL